MINLHPPATTFPFAFVLLLCAIEIWLFFRPAAHLFHTRDLVLGAYGIGVVLAFFSGYHGSEFADLEQETLAAAVSLHHTIGKILLFVTIPTVLFGLVYTRATQGKYVLCAGYYVLLCIALGLTLYTGYLGGELVFSYGAGVEHSPR